LLHLERPALDRLRGNRLSLVPQNPTTALSPSMRVGVQIAEVLQFHKAESGQETTYITELFRMVGLPDPEAIGRRYPHQLSGGQQQRVCIAMALACKPDLLVLDEPTTGLDVTTQEQIIELLADLRARLGMSMLYVTMTLACSRRSPRVGVMYAGRMAEIAPTAVLFAEPRHPYTRGLIASIPQIEKPTSRPALCCGSAEANELPPGCLPTALRFRRSHLRDGSTAPDAVADGHVVACRRWRALPPPQAIAANGQALNAGKRIAPDHILSLDGVSLGYGASSRSAIFPGSSIYNVVQDLTFAIKAGETFALVGESGSGKSTVARAVSGLLAPRAGGIQFEARSCPPLLPSDRANCGAAFSISFRIPTLPESADTDRSYSGTATRSILQSRSRCRRKASYPRLEDVRLDVGYATRYPDQLSGGERQRVAVARALVAESKLLLCDEILSGLDVSVQANVLALLQQLRQEHHLSMLFISHDLAVVRTLADRVGVLFRGQLMEVGGVEEIFTPPFHPIPTNS
jgi:peptide/nickel transport system ATP-binding protein